MDTGGPQEEIHQGGGDADGVKAGGWYARPKTRANLVLGKGRLGAEP